jgi:hypothetical protein
MSPRHLTIFVLLAAVSSFGQMPAERSFTAPVAKVEAAVKKLPGGTSGPLPLLDGFINSGGRSLQGLERPYYQCTVHVTRTVSGGSLVRVSAKITAWNSDPAHPRYEVLPSNGRLESDLLDRLEQSLDASATVNARPATARTSTGNNGKVAAAPDISAPMPQLPRASAISKLPNHQPDQNSGLEQQAKSLEDIIRNQGHPTDLVAVKEDQTPVLQDPSSDAKILFLASARDEFQILDINPEWVHVRISGLSRGWVRRTSVEMLTGSDVPLESAPATTAHDQMAASASSTSSSRSPVSSSLFSVTDEEDGSFPGDWAPLKGKNVRIISVQQTPGTGKNTSPQDKMRFAETVFKAQQSKESAAGLVLIFDAEDGGIIAATRSVLDMWKSGALSEQAFWKQCYLDPPEILGTL